MKFGKTATAAYLNECATALLSIPHRTIDSIAGNFRRARDANGIIYFLGNGACASLAEHMAADFAKQDLIATHRGDQQSLRTHSLVSNSALLTALGNDIGFEDVFAFQLRGNIVRQDVVVALSASGSSTNVLRAADEATKVGATVISMTGAMEPDPPLRRKSHLTIQVPTDQIDQIEDVHVAVHHAILRSYIGLVQQ